MKHATKIEPAPLPNGGMGGFLRMAGNRFGKIQEAEKKALEAKHAVDWEKLNQKHQEQRTKTTKAPRPKKSA